MTLVWTDSQERRAVTPVLDQINALMSAVEAGGALPVSIALGRRQTEALPAEIAAARTEGILVDPLIGGEGTIWGVAVEHVDADHRIAVARETRG